MRVVGLGLVLAALACQPSAPPTPPASEPASPPVSAGASDEVDEPEPEPVLEPRGAFEAGSDDVDVWGDLEGESFGEAYGLGGLSRPRWMGAMPEAREFDTAAQALAAYEAELPWTRENIQVLREGARRLRRRVRELEAARPVDDDALAQARRRLEVQRESLEGWERTLERYEARIAELEPIVEAERERRRELYESGVCVHEPCPPDTVKLSR